MKRILFLLGIILLTLAFLVTGAELAARAIGTASGESGGMLLSLGDVWRRVAPGSFTALHHSAYWPMLRPVLAIPGWILFGGPGLALVIVCHARDEDATTRAQIQDHEDSLYLFDELASAAQKEGYDAQHDDRAPSDPADTVPAEAHFATDPIEAELLPERDFLLDPASRSKATDGDR